MSRFLIATVLVAGAFGVLEAQTGVDRAFAAFTARTDSYVQMHRRIEGPVPPLTASQDMAEIRRLMADVRRRTLVFLALSVLAGLGAAWLLEVSWERALYLAPVLVLGSLAVVALVVLWAKVIVETARGSRRKHDDSVTDP